MQRHVRTKERTDTLYQLEHRRQQQAMRAARARQRAAMAAKQQQAVPVIPVNVPSQAEQSPPPPARYDLHSPDA
jgi:hypothetical protein